jgi:hypothetical protein
MRILVPTYREINWILYPYAHLHKKYWGERITVVAEQPYINSDEELKDCFDFFAPNFDGNTIEGGEYHETLKQTLRHFDDKFVTIMCADYLIYKPVDVAMITVLLEYMDTHDNVLRANLGINNGMGSSPVVEKFNNIEIREGNFLPTSLTPGIWNRELLFEMMEHEMPTSKTAWDVEVKGHDALCNNHLRSIGVAPEPIHYINAIRGRQNYELYMIQEIYDQIKHLIPDNIKLPEEIVK